MARDSPLRRLPNRVVFREFGSAEESPMFRRTDAGRSTLIVFWSAVMGLAGCAALDKRDARPANPSPVNVAPRPQPSGVMPVSHVEEQPPGAPRPATPGVTADADPLARLLRDAEQACAEYSCYICRLRRRENGVTGKEKPEEIIAFKC